MKTIGIKLADGSFYPILKEGTAEKKELNLTTVKDNQTTVQVDLYRSETESMQDAEYVDTLEIKHLIKHPNGEPDIALDISIDENNELHAELHDPETGKDSSTTVSLVSRTIEQRSEPSDVTIAETEDFADFSDIAADDDFDLEKNISTPVQDDSFSADDDFNFDPNSLNVDSIVEEPSEENQEAFDETVETDSTDTEESDSKNNAAVAAGAGLLGAAAALALKNKKDESSETSDSSNDSDETISEEISDDIFSDDTIADETSLSENVSDEVLSDTADTAISDDDFNIPDDFSDDFSIDDTFDEMSDSESADTISDESVTEPTNDETTETQTDEASTENAENTETEDSLFNDSFEQEENLSASNNAGLDFSDILDEETKEGHASDSIESEVINKKTKVPVTICITCAVICIIAVLLILFVIPSKFNLVKKQAEKESAKTITEQTKAPEQKETQPKYEAKENEIVIAPAEKVVPEVPQEKPANTKNITYKIKWGDTLWDLAKSYYNNPWKYPKIAKYNGIKNPDHIISGTTIIIPAE